MAAHPPMAVAEEAPYRIVIARLDPSDHHAREELVPQRERDDARIKMAERNSPLLHQRAQWVRLILEHGRKIPRLDQESCRRLRCERRRTQLRKPRNRVFGGG